MTTKTVKTKKFVKYIWTLADGTEIQTSSVGEAQLRGVATGGSLERNFIAFLADSWVPKRLKHLLNAPNSAMHHLGGYTDSRDAAAVSALAQDPKLMEYMLVNYQSHGCTVDCPNRYPESDLCESRFDIPAAITNAEVATHRRELTRNNIAKKDKNPQLSLKKYVKRMKGVDLSNSTSRMLFDKKHGAKVVLEAILTLTGYEFVEKFWA